MSNIPTTEFKSSDIAVFISVCFFFTMEGILHYSIGKTGKFSVIIPPWKDLSKILVIVVTFSLLSTFTQRMILNCLGEEE